MQRFREGFRSPLVTHIKPCLTPELGGTDAGADVKPVRLGCQCLGWAEESLVPGGEGGRGAFRAGGAGLPL